MLTPLLGPDVVDEAPTSPVLIEYDEQRLLTYIRLLDTAAEDADWREVAKIVLHIDPATGPDRACQRLAKTFCTPIHGPHSEPIDNHGPTHS